MAAADTAKLIASLELKDKFSPALKKMSGALNGFDAKLSQTQGRAFKAGQQIGTGIRNGLKIATVAIGLLATQVIVGLNQLVALEEQTAATNAALLSTKGVSGQTAASIRNLAEKYENLNAVMDDKVIQSAENVLLTFTNIRKEAFEPALAAALDLSTAMGQDLQSSIVQIGKALNDPAKGFTALRRVGIQFTKDQEAQIKALQESGDLLSAQKIILQELGTEFGGRFAAQGKTAKGTIAGIGDAVEDLQKALATSLFPTVQRLLPRLRETIASPQFVATVGKLGDAISGLFSNANIEEGARVLSGLFKAAQDAAPALQQAAQITGEVIKTAVGIFKSLPPEIQALAVAGLAINKLTGGLVTNIAGGLISAVLSSFKGVLAVQAGIVNVNGAVGAGGLPVTPGIGWASLFALIGPAVVAALASKAIADQTNLEFADRGFKTNFVAPGSGGDEPLLAILPFGIGGALQNIAEIGKVLLSPQSPTVKATEAVKDSFDRQLPAVVTAQEGLKDSFDRMIPPLQDSFDRAVISYQTEGDLTRAAIADGFKALSNAEARRFIDADKRARGLSGRHGPSTTLEPRFRFLRQDRAGSKDVDVARALAVQFERQRTPVFKSTENLRKAIRILIADQKTVGAKSAAEIGKDIDRLKAELKRRTDAAANKTSNATKVSGAAVKAAIKAKDLSVKVALNNTAQTFLNGRLIEANVSRFSSVYQSGHGTADIN